MSIDEHVHDQQGASSDARPAGAPATDLRVGGRRRLVFGGVATAFAAIATACSSDEDTGSSTPSSESTQSGPVSTSSAVTTRDSSTAAAGDGTTPATTAGGSDTTTAEGDEILRNRGIPVVPDIMANSGGVVVSYFEWVQDRHGYFWTEAQVNERLEEKMVAAYAALRESIHRYALVNDLRTAAYTVGMTRILEARRLRGLYA